MKSKPSWAGVIAGIAFGILVVVAAGRAFAQVPEATGLVLAESLLPEAARAGARLVARDTRGERVVRPGDGFVCVSDSSGAGHLSLNCHHEAVHPLLALEREVSVLGLQGVERSRWLCDRVAEQGVVVPNGAMELSATLTVEPDGSLPDEMTIYYLLYLPGATTATTAIGDQNPGDASPWLHLAGSCRSHVMWFETRPLPAVRQRSAAFGE